MANRCRALSTTAALLGGFALTLQLVLTIGMALDNGRDVPTALWRWIGYFTITTNLLASIALAAAAVGNRSAWSRFFGRPDVQSMTAMSIVIVSAIYNVLLRQLWHPQGWSQLANLMLHDVMPALFVIHWWLAVPKHSLRWRHIGLWLLYPAGFFAYVMLRGAVDHWYPYPFVDVTALGYRQVLLNAALILLAFVAVAVLLTGLARWQVRHQSAAGATL